ncbi:GNAT family N-acetyltransferase [Phocaeicola coprocola]|uniref:GNAT family N-acetyltransferase n=1 Tax=Phocaeicola coprocola TaxID=310298 RepID=UPI0032BFF83F
MTEEIKLHTERLIIRTPQAEDAQDIFTLMKDQDTAMITGFTPMNNISEAEGKIRGGISSGNMFVITTEENPNHTIGVFEIDFQKISTIHGEKQEYTICYFLHKNFRGKGYMTEVVKSMKRYLFMERQADTLIISIFPRDDASRRVAIKNGFIFKALERKCGM